MIAAIKERGERGGKRGHAGSQHYRVFGAFQTGQLFFKVPLIWVAVTGVEVHVRAGPIDI